MCNHNVLHEAKLLMLDISKAKFQLGWKPRMNIHRCIELTVDWYKRYKTEDAYDICLDEVVRKSYFFLHGTLVVPLFLTYINLPSKFAAEF